ncbi:MAG TPA: class I SAM-dependent methyltransferase [Candidatus Binatia bacterium]|nr:class I SAM-dependent methyltransferase [Candidatus Binatia bacterium]
MKIATQNGSTESLEQIRRRIRANLEGRGRAADDGGAAAVRQLLEHIRGQLDPGIASPVSTTPSPAPDAWTAATGARKELWQVQRQIEAAAAAHRQTGQLNPRLPGIRNEAIQSVKKMMRRALGWYARPIQAFQEATLHSIRHLAAALQEHDSTLQRHAAAIQQLQSGRGSLGNGPEDTVGRTRHVQDSVTEDSRQAMLKENERIIAYWDRAAQSDPMRETVTQGANETDEEYLRNWERVGEYVAQKIISYSPPNPVALEVGPGMGRITVPMLRYCRSITALDISPEMVRRTQETLAGLQNFRAQLITDEDLSFLPAEHFDLAYAISCFQHADKKSFYRYLEGIRRALRPGGVLFFGVINLCSEAGWGHFAAILRSDYPEFFHTADEISCYLTHAGYSSHQLAYEGETLWAIAQR